MSQFTLVNLVSNSLIGLFFVSQSSASGYFTVKHLSKEKQRSVFLQADNCESLKHQVIQLSDKKVNLEYKNVDDEYGDNQCQVNISSLLSKDILKNDQRVASLNGPNCWGTALKLKTINNSIRFTQDKEFTFWLNTPYCKPINKKDLKKGDVIAIRERDSETKLINEIHGQIYLTDELVFSKNTSGVSSMFELIRSDLVYGTYRTSEKCLSGEQNGECTRWTDYYRCTSPSKDIKILSLQNKLFANLSSKANTLEKVISDLAMNQVKDKMYDARNDLLTELNSLADQLPAEQSSNKKENVFWDGLTLKISSLIKQVNFTQGSSIK